VVSDLSCEWNPPELRPQSRAKADLGTASKHHGSQSTQPSRACTGPFSVRARAVPLRLGPYLPSTAELGAKAEKGARPVTRRRGRAAFRGKGRRSTQPTSDVRSAWSRAPLHSIHGMDFPRVTAQFRVVAIKLWVAIEERDPSSRWHRGRRS
jgi:hypothetical protein